MGLGRGSWGFGGSWGGSCGVFFLWFGFWVCVCQGVFGDCVRLCCMNF